VKLIPYFCDLRWIGYRTVSEKQANIFNVNNPVFLVHDEAFVWTVVFNIIGHILLPIMVLFYPLFKNKLYWNCCGYL